MRSLGSLVFVLVACSGGGDEPTSGTDGSGTGGTTSSTVTSESTGTAGGTGATGSTQSTGSTGSSGAEGSGGTSTTSGTGSTGGIDPDPLCMDFCAKKIECGIDGGQSMADCQAACLQAAMDAANLDCELAILSQLACVAGLTCDEVVQWAGGDPVKPAEYPCKYTDVAIGEDCY